MSDEIHKHRLNTAQRQRIAKTTSEARKDLVQEAGIADMLAQIQGVLKGRETEDGRKAEALLNEVVERCALRLRKEKIAVAAKEAARAKTSGEATRLKEKLQRRGVRLVRLRRQVGKLQAQLVFAERAPPAKTGRRAGETVTALRELQRAIKQGRVSANLPITDAMAGLLVTDGKSLAGIETVKNWRWAWAGEQWWAFKTEVVAQGAAVTWWPLEGGRMPEEDQARAKEWAGKPDAFRCRLGGVYDMALWTNKIEPVENDAMGVFLVRVEAQAAGLGEKRLFGLVERMNVMQFLHQPDDAFQVMPMTEALSHPWIEGRAPQRRRRAVVRDAIHRGLLAVDDLAREEEWARLCADAVVERIARAEERLNNPPTSVIQAGDAMLVARRTAFEQRIAALKGDRDKWREIRSEAQRAQLLALVGPAPKARVRPDRP